MTKHAKKQKILHTEGQINQWDMPQNDTKDIINRQDIKAIIITIFLMLKKVKVENFKKTYGRYKNDVSQTCRNQNIWDEIHNWWNNSNLDTVGERINELEEIARKTAQI